MRRFMIAVTVTLLMAAMLVLTMSPALSITKTIDKASPVVSAVSSGGVAVDPALCEVLGDDSSMFGWRPGGVCWFTPPL